MLQSKVLSQKEKQVMFLLCTQDFVKKTTYTIMINEDHKTRHGQTSDCTSMENTMIMVHRSSLTAHAHRGSESGLGEMTYDFGKVLPQGCYLC